MATVTFSAADDLLYAYLAGEIDHDAAQNLRIQLDDALLARTPKTLVLDLGGVGFMDSSGVGLILGRGRQMSGLGGRAASAAPAVWAEPCVSSTPRNSCAAFCGWPISPARMQDRRNEDESGKHDQDPI